MENLENEIKEESLWDIKMGKIARILTRERLIRRYNRLEGEIRINNEKVPVMTLTYSQSQDRIYIRCWDDFYKDENNNIKLDKVINTIKNFYKNQDIFVF